MEQRSAGDAPRNLLVVDDDFLTRELVAAALPRWTVHEAHNGARGIEVRRSRVPDLVLLDLGLPDMNGLAVLREIRSSCTTPIIVLTGDARSETCVQALRDGADDYLVKPFNPDELEARIDATFRRIQMNEHGDHIIALDGFRLDTVARTAQCGNRHLRLAPREFRLLEFLATHPRRAFSRMELIEHVWGFDDADVHEATVTEHVYKLRQKLKPECSRLLVTVHGFGYRFDPPAAS